MTHKKIGGIKPKPENTANLVEAAIRRRMDRITWEVLQAAQDPESSNTDDAPPDLWNG